MTTLAGPLPAVETASRRVHARLTRDPHGRLLAGVASGTARHLGLPTWQVRLAFVLLAFAGGAGLAMYGALWAFVPRAQRPGEPAEVRSAGQWFAFVVLGVGALIALQAGGLASPAVLPLLLVAGGAALVWLQADPAQRSRWRSAGRPSGAGAVTAVGAGALLVVLGLVGFLAARGQLREAQQGLLSTLVVVLGLGLVSAPWWLRMSGDLRAERRERIRSQERAEIAAHVHDSVLQTLAMIRKASDDPREVSRLARTQERELRSWLYAPRSEQQLGRYAAALEQIAAEVELAHGVLVEVVVVGDCDTCDPVLALTKAVREALVNAAEHAQAPSVSLYSEVDERRVEAFVRDRGVGFDMEAVPADRFGLRQSVIGRLERHGGTASVHTRPGAGTEVRMSVDRS